MSDLTIFSINNAIQFNQPIFILGAFESFHIGHYFLLEQALKIKQEDQDIVLVYFKDVDKLPKNKNQKIFMDLKSRIQTFANLNFKYAIELVYEEIKNLDANDFLNKLFENQEDFQIITGKDFCFGKDKKGNVELLSNTYPDRVFSFELMKLENKIKISTSYLKENLELGNIDFNNKLLIEPYQISAILHKDLTLDIDDLVLKVPEGIYASSLIIKDYEYKVVLLNDGQKYRVKFLDFNYKGKNDLQQAYLLIEKEIRFFANNENKEISKNDVFEVKKHYFE
ncbi:FAD synthase [Mycoplasmopsis hyopharyngis]|uniref:FAD synthase n=1 Tax=Mycoplasmopsis hyopharyngis TaxID=29558 RepID=UPI003873A201